MWYDPNAAVVECELILDLAGPFRLREARGADLTPKSRKAQGLLALVGTSPCMRRSRHWLQDKLWSDRGAEQGSASLRQCLTDIRSTLRDHRGCFRTDSGWVSLDPGRVLVNTTVSERDEEANVEFLEGLDIRDPEFEHWLRDQRLSHSRPSDRADGQAPDPRTATELVRAQEAQIAALEQLVGRQALEIEFLKAALRNGPAPQDPAPPAMLCGAAYQLRKDCRQRASLRPTRAA
jgi:hypothetical protein